MTISTATTPAAIVGPWAPALPHCASAWLVSVVNQLNRVGTGTDLFASFPEPTPETIAVTLQTERADET